MTPLTADTVTQAQIHDLWNELLAEDIRSTTGADVRQCKIALGIWPEIFTKVTRAMVREARARCAEILAARAAKSSRTEVRWTSAEERRQAELAQAALGYRLDGVYGGLNGPGTSEVGVFVPIAPDDPKHATNCSCGLCEFAARAAKEGK